MIEHEIVQHEKLRDIHIFLNSIHMRSRHMHHDNELLFVLHGKGTVLTKEKSFALRTGDSLLIGAYESHEILAPEEPLTALFVQFSNHFLRDYFPPVKTTVFSDGRIRERFSEEDYALFGEKILKLGEAYFASEPYYELRCVSLFADVLSSLLARIPFEELGENRYMLRKKANRRIERIASCIEAHCQEPLRLSDLARQEGITETHLSHVIKDGFGMNFQEYLRDKRLECALRLIGDPSLTLSEVALNSGFSELKYMNAAFQSAFGISPREYRDKQIPRKEGKQKTSFSEYIYTPEESLAYLADLDLAKTLCRSSIVQRPE